MFDIETIAPQVQRDRRGPRERASPLGEGYQITTAVADGTIAALAVQKFLRDNR